jgi:hypothetical protein
MPPSALPPPPFWRTAYFEAEVRFRPDRRNVRTDDIIAGLRNPARTVIQQDGRFRLWYYVGSAGRWLRIVTLADGVTVHNAFFDRGFRP